MDDDGRRGFHRLREAALQDVHRAIVRRDAEGTERAQRRLDAIFAALEAGRGVRSGDKVAVSAREAAAALLYWATRIDEGAASERERAEVEKAVAKTRSTLPLARSSDDTVKATVLQIDEALKAARSLGSGAVDTCYIFLGHVVTPATWEGNVHELVDKDLVSKALVASERPGRRRAGELGLNDAIAKIARSLGVHVKPDTVARYRRQAAAGNPDAK